MGLRNIKEKGYNSFNEIFEHFWEQYTEDFEYIYKILYSDLKNSSLFEEYKQYNLKYVDWIIDIISDSCIYILNMDVFTIAKQLKFLSEDLCSIRNCLKYRNETNILCIKLRNCCSFSEYKDIVENDGLKFVKSYIQKNKLKIIAQYTNKNNFYKLLNYIFATTIYTEFIKYNVFPDKLKKYRDFIFRYDYLDNGQILDMFPERYASTNTDNGRFKLLSREIEDCIITNGHIPNKLVTDWDYHLYMIFKIGKYYELSNLESSRKVDKFMDSIIERYDIYIMESSSNFEMISKSIENIIEKIAENVIKESIQNISNKSVEAIFESARDKYLKILEESETLNKEEEHIHTVMKISNIYKVEMAKEISNLGWLPKKSNINKLEKYLEYMEDFTEFYLETISNILTNQILDNLQEIFNCLEEYIKITNKDIELDNDLKYKNLKTCSEKLNYISSSRELSNLAKSFGYNKVRQNGDHGIFKKLDGSTIVIPQGRKIGKGLSLKIQKDIKNI